MRSGRLGAALRYGFGGFLVTVLLTAGTGTALADQHSTDLGATCDGWSVTLSGFDPAWNTRITILIDGQVLLDTPFSSSFGPLPGEWQTFQATHTVRVEFARPGFTDYAASHAALGCPESAPTTIPTTQAPTPTTPSTSATTQAPSEESASTSSVVTTTIPVSTTTTELGTNDAAATDVTTVAAEVDDSDSGSSMTTLLVGVMVGLGLVGAFGGVWFLGKRAAQT